MEEVGMQIRDLHAGLEDGEGNNEGVELFEEEETMETEDGTLMWLEMDQEDLLNETSMFDTEFPHLPDFQSMSSSSSSPSMSTSSHVKAMASSSCSSSSSSASSSSSSSAASWAIPKSDADEDGEKRNRLYGLHDQAPAKLSSTASTEIARGPGHGVDIMDVLETFGCMEMLDSSEVFGPSCIFQSENEPHGNQENPNLQIESNGSNGGMMEEKEEEDRDTEEMGRVFLEWLRTNRETVSAEDLRSVKIKKSTIESAARRLGGGKDGIKRLLKLILEWVQTNHLQKRRLKGPFPSPSPNSNSDSIVRGSSNSSCFAPNPWPIQPPTFATNPTAAAVPTAPPSYPPPMAGYMGRDPNPPHDNQFQMLDSSLTWPPLQFSSPSMDFGSYPVKTPQLHQQWFSSGNEKQYQYLDFHGQGEKLQRLGSSATKEARQKRMARQRRVLSHHRHHSVHRNHNEQNQFSDQGSDHQQLRTDENCTTELAPLAPPNSSNRVYWPSQADGVSPRSPNFSSDHLPMPPSYPPSIHNQTSAGKTAFDRGQGWKPEKNLKFLLQKVLKQSDVGGLGRIVLPKKEAETHLPELGARDGISIAMEDIATSQVWSMRYRYWPNNKSKMYLLENTGDFVKANGLKEGDFIVIYSDLKCGKYMIRGVKVRQQGLKSGSRRQGKSQKNLQENAAFTTPSTTL